MPSLTKQYEFWSPLGWFGRFIFSWLVTFAAPYTGSLPLRTQSLDTKQCITMMYDWFWIRNPFGSIHAAALTNMGEATMGFAALYWAETTKHRAIPVRLEIDFYKKAKGTLRAQCELPEMEVGEIILETNIYDKQGDLVSKVTGTWKISKSEPKKIK